jgi:hypothetical protein
MTEGNAERYAVDFKQYALRHRPVSCYEFRGHVKSLTALHTAPLECGLGVADV